MNPLEPTLTQPPQEPADSSQAAWDVGLAAAFAPAETASHHPAAEPQAGTILGGKFRLSERVGEGGMGSVWVAHQSEPVKRKARSSSSRRAWTRSPSSPGSKPSGRPSP